MQRTQVDGSAPSAMRSGRVYYLNGSNNDLGYEKEVTDSGMTEHKHYLSAGGMVFAMQITRSGNLAQGGSTKPAENLQYLHTDHLGSVAVVTDQDGSVTERLAYDPWGKRRFPNGTADTNDSIIGLTLDRGFTMHEHLDEMGLIHMNGRIFDPLIGRFMSADPFIQAPENLQSHNRFAYVMNNPLSYTDPSGYFSLKKLFRAVVAIAVGYFTGQWIGQLFQGSALAGGASTAFANVGYAGSASAAAGGLTSLGGALAGAAGGFAGGLVGSGSLKGAINGAFSGGVFGGIGGLGLDGGAAVAAHAAGGCITSVASGGSCSSGALSAAFGKFSTIQTQDWGAGVAQFTASVVAGGVGSVIGGGKFESGATTAAYAYLFNNCLANLGGCLNAGARLVQGAYSRLQMLAGSPAGQMATQLAAAEIGMASPAAPRVYGKAVNGVADLLDAVPDWSRVHSGNKDVQGFVWGNAQQLFSHLTKNATEINPRVFRTADDFLLHMHSSSTNGVSSLTIKAPDTAGQFTIRMQQPSAIPLPSH
jgi:RHS repeat-associated protein